MLVRLTPIPLPEAQAFDDAVLASGRDPGAFRLQMFEADGDDGCVSLRRVHVVSPRAAAQYDASAEPPWTETFARHLARGFFG